jgi:hypothetical protein
MTSSPLCGLSRKLLGDYVSVHLTASTFDESSFKLLGLGSLVLLKKLIKNVVQRPTSQHVGFRIWRAARI